MLQFRSEILYRIRSFFRESGYLEVDTPSLSPSLIPETCLEVFETLYHYPWSSKTLPLYLVPSPEVYIKQLLSQHKVSMFQLSKCFRNIESTGRTHSPEFTMLEYYTIAKDYRFSIELTQKMIADLCRTCYAKPDHVPTYLTTTWEILTMQDAFIRFAKLSLKDSETTDLLSHAHEIGLSPEEDSPWDDLYELIFVQQVEPSLPQDHPVVLIDYPARVPCLAKNATDGFSKERWELYIRGVEVANCYTEAAALSEIQSYMESESQIKKQTAIVPHPVDSDYAQKIAALPLCSGVALGIDRLIMLLANRQNIDSVLPFPLTVSCG